MSKRCMGCMEMYEDWLQVCPNCGYIEGTPADEAIHLKPGTLLHDRYMVGRALGFGGFGITYIGWDGTLQQKVAIKEYLPSEFSTRMPERSAVMVFSGDKQEQFQSGLEKFLDEAKRLAKFQNEPGIVKIFDSFPENGTAYIIMEYLDGETLSERLEREGKIPEDEAVNMLRPVMHSLEVVHREGLLHRDIAPDNIFLTKDGSVKLIDFGASRYATTTHSRSLTVIIKPGFSPEEQYRSRGDQGAYTDVYALAATLYKMITGVTPPDALERRALVETKRRDLLVSPHKYQKNISTNREIAILNALNVQIEDRTPDIPSFLDELDANPPAKRVYGKIKKIDLYSWPLWLKIVVPAALCAVITVGVLLVTGVINFKSLFSGEIIVPEGMVIVPELEGMDKDEAVEKLKKADLTPSVGGNAVSEYIEAGKIVYQTPAGGSYLEEQGPVALTISSGNGVIPPFNGESFVPYVVWDLEDDAIGKLKEAGLAYPLLKEQNDETVDIGKVISQSVEYGEKLPVGSQITLVISLGPETFEMPNVVGKTQEAAEATLNEYGLSVNLDNGKSNDIPKGSIINQSIAVGASVRKGNVITITVCTGRETYPVPNVVGKTKADAEVALKNVGFIVEVSESYDAKVPVGNVVSQDPGTEKEQKEGTKIKIIVSKGPQPVSVSFDANGGSASFSSANLFVGSPYGSLPNASRTGYNFTGWYTSKSGGNKVESGTTVSNTSNHTLYAQWSPISVSVSLDANGGSVSSSSVKVTFGSTYDNLPKPSRTGYGFTGWYTAKSGGSKVDSSTKVTNASNHTLYAQWTIGTYTVSLDANGGSVSPSSVKVTYGSAYSNLPTPSRTGFSFNGWYTATSGGTKITNGTTFTGSSDHTLYAQWTASTYTVTLDANGGSVSPTTIKVTYGGTYANLPKPSRSGFSFAGWYTSKSGGTKVDSGTKVTSTSNHTLYAIWSTNSYTVSWSNGTGYTISVKRTSSPNAGASTGSLNSGATVYYGDVLSVTYSAKSGYRITSSGPTSITVTGNVTSIYATAGPSSFTYQIVYKSVNGTSLGSDSVTHDYGGTYTITPPAKSGYTTPAAQTVTWDSESKTITFTYGIGNVGNTTKTGWVGTIISYSATVQYQNRTANSVQIRVVWTSTIKAGAYDVYSQNFKANVGSVSTGNVQVAAFNQWASSSGSARSSTGTSPWITVPLNTTNQTSVDLHIYYWQANYNGTDMYNYDGTPCVNATWNIPLPAY